jgi:hypothetical protein
MTQIGHEREIRRATKEALSFERMVRNDALLTLAIDRNLTNTEFLRLIIEADMKKASGNLKERRVRITQEQRDLHKFLEDLDHATRVY